MKQSIIILGFVLAVVSIQAQNPLLDDMPYVSVVQDSTIERLLDTKIHGQQLEEQFIDGFRVQVFSSNVQQKGKADAIALEKSLSPLLAEPIYVFYQSPTWKVRIGDFRTFEEAQEYKNELVKQFPQLQGSSYVIGDKIRVIP